MKWFKHDSDESESPLVVELIEGHSLRGHYFWIRLNEILAKYFNSWCPGCYRFKTRIFYAFFYPHIKDNRTMRKMLDFIHHKHKVYSHITGSNIYIYYPDIIIKADRYTQEEIRKRKERGEEQPDDARGLAFLCTNFAPDRSKTLDNIANDSAKNKEVKSKLMNRGVSI
jgi:hypothetical protein